MARLNPTYLPMASWGAYLERTLASRNYMFYDKLLIIENFAPLLSRFNNPDLILDKVKEIIEKRSVIVLVNHHWEYYFDWSQLDHAFFAAWQGLVEYLLQKDNLQLLTFSELYNRLSNKI
jgi:hypothetical protein